MRSYRCYLLDAKLHIATVDIVECGDDDDAKRRGREILAANGFYRAVEIWDRERRVALYPAEEGHPAPVP